MSLVNPLFEVGVQYTLNPNFTKNNTKPKINSSAPEEVTFTRHLKAGDIIPIALSTSGNLFEVSARKLEMKLVQDLFIQVTNNQALFSLDKSDWKPFEELISGTLDFKIIQPMKGSVRAVTELFVETLSNEASTKAA